MGIRQMIKGSLIRVFEKRYQRKLDARKGTYGQWISAKRSAGRPGEEQEARQVLIFCSDQGEPAADMIRITEEYFRENPGVNIASGDETAGDPEHPESIQLWAKPEWSPENFKSCFYFGSVIAVRRSWLEELTGSEEIEEAEIAKFTEGREPECGYYRMCMTGEASFALKEFIGRLTQIAGKEGSQQRQIGHIPQVLFHVPDPQVWEACRGQPGAETEEVNCPGISVIIPSKDHPDILIRCLNSLFESSGSAELEVTVVDNGSSEENRRKVEAFLGESPVPCRYLYRPMEFNFSVMCNLGAEASQKELLLFLNDDVECVPGDWLQKMARAACRPENGAVGLKLRYPGGRKIQHAGIVNLPIGPVHKLQFHEDDETSCGGYNLYDRNVIAVTGACLMVEREKFRKAGCMKEELAVAFNDVELCFSLWKAGYHNVVINSAFAYHHESLSRGDDESEQKLLRLTKERRKLYRLHPDLEGKDPYYPENFNREIPDTSIRPAYVTAANTVQEGCFKETEVNFAAYRKDACVLFRLERCDEEQIRGYAVVLGDNNACYRKKLLLWRLSEDERAKSGEERIRCFCLEVQGQYRPDLEEHMKDQKNVALSGFCVKTDSLPAGSYRPAVLAESMAGGSRLYYFSSRRLQIGCVDSE